MKLHVVNRWRSIQAFFTIKMAYSFKCNFTWAVTKVRPSRCRASRNVQMLSSITCGHLVRTATKCSAALLADILCGLPQNVLHHCLQTSCADCHKIFCSITCGHLVRIATKCSAALRADILCILPQNVEQHYVRTSCADCHQIGQHMWPVRAEICLGRYMKSIFRCVVVHWLGNFL